MTRPVTIFLSWFFHVSGSIGIMAHARADEKLTPIKVADEQTIVFIGDSITQGYGVKLTEAYPALVEHILKMRGYHVHVLNGGISGSTTADADQRVRWYLRGHPEIIVLALGENDALKGAPVAVMKANLEKAIDLAQKSGIKVLLVGSEIYTNFGSDYARDLKKVFAELAKEKKVPLMPFLLDDVALHKHLMQADEKHPNPRGQAIVAQNMATRLVALLPRPKATAVKEQGL